MNKIVFYLILLTSTLNAKPFIDLQDENIASAHKAFYERPEFIWTTQGKNSHVVVLTDRRLSQASRMRELGYEKVVAYLMEPRVILPSIYDYINAHADQFDLILTFDEQLLSKFPGKCQFVHAVGWGTLHDHGIHKKSKMCSIMTGKNYTEGHRLRLEAYERYEEYFDGYKGYNTSWERWKDPWLNDFHFSVIIENSQCPHYFTEKITECLRAGTVPIYWGCPTIGEFFDIEGFMLFNTLEELGEILQNLSIEEYQKRLPAIHRNFELAAKYPENNLTGRPDYPDSMDGAWVYLRPFFDK